MNEVRASVAMAVYNGEKYIREQINSIISLLGPSDELIISYDKSTDHTLDIIKSYEEKDCRIKTVLNIYKPGVSGNFTNAVSHTRGKYIFLSDQDDIWLNDKINRVVEEMERTSADLVIHDGRFANENLELYEETLFVFTNSSKSPFKNFIKGRFLGCCMCFRREAMSYILPFPDITNDFPHDIFAAIMVGIKGKVVLVDDVCIYHRMHGGNATPKNRNRLFVIVLNRLILFICIISRLLRNKGFYK
ncbi:MAG: glycosyltransferase [Candidatus Methanofastidiosum sp.]|nr:glycosyltransferase [Methanofastidiosum sp.]